MGTLTQAVIVLIFFQRAQEVLGSTLGLVLSFEEERMLEIDQVEQVLMLIEFFHFAQLLGIFYFLLRSKGLGTRLAYLCFYP